MFVVTSVAFGALAAGRVRVYLATGYDLGIFDQAVQHYAAFQTPLIPLKGVAYSIWGDHFHPIIALWAPLYWVWDDVRALVVGQAIVVAATVFPLWRFVRRRWGESVWARAFVVLVVWAWPLAHLITFDVHEIAFAVPILAWALDALDRRHAPALAVSCGALLLVREDMGVLVFMIGAVWLLWHGRGRRTRADWVVGGALMAGGLVVFALVTTWIIPHFAQDGYAYWDYPSLGDSPKAALITLVTRPWTVVADLFWPAFKARTWLLLLAPVGFLALRSPYALVALPIMAERMLAGRENLWSPAFHYDAPVWIIVAIAAVDGYRRLPARWRPGLAVLSPFAAAAAALLVWTWLYLLHHVPVDAAIMFALLVGVAGIAWYPWRGWTWLRPLAVALCALAVGATLWTQAVVDVRRALPVVAAKDALRAFVPADTCVVADNSLAPAFTHTNRTTEAGIPMPRADFYVLDFGRQFATLDPLFWTPKRAYDDAVAHGFAEVYRAAQFVVLQAPDYAGPDPLICGPLAP